MCPSILTRPRRDRSRRKERKHTRVRKEKRGRGACVTDRDRSRGPTGPPAAKKGKRKRSTEARGAALRRSTRDVWVLIPRGAQDTVLLLHGLDMAESIRTFADEVVAGEMICSTLATRCGRVAGGIRRSLRRATIRGHAMIRPDPLVLGQPDADAGLVFDLVIHILLLRLLVIVPGVLSRLTLGELPLQCMLTGGPLQRPVEGMTNLVRR